MGLFDGLGLDQPSGGLSMLGDLAEWIRNSSPGNPRTGTGPATPFSPAPTGALPPPQGFDDSTVAPPPAPGTPPVQDLVVPDVIAKNAAARGIGPPPADFAPSWADTRGLNVGAALTGQTVTPTPMPRPRPTDTSSQARAPGAPLDITSEAQKAGTGGAQQKPTGDRLMEALKGVKAPANPELQRISSPSAPRAAATIKGGDIIALLQSLGAQRAQGGLDLPASLGQALRR